MKPARADPVDTLSMVGGDLIRLNLFFDLLDKLSKTRDFNSLGTLLGMHLRFVIDFDDCYFVLGNPEKFSTCQVYVSTKAAPRSALSKLGSKPSTFFKQLFEAKSVPSGSKAGGKIICLLLSARGDALGAIILTRFSPFKNSEYRFAESISGFLAQMLDSFARTEDLAGAHERAKDGENHQKVLVKKLEEEREVRERFVSALSHDLRSPLTAAKLASQLLKRKSHDSKMVEMLSQRITASVDRVDRMILDLLDANRIKAGQEIPTLFEECDFKDIINSSVEDMMHVYGPRFKIAEIEGSATQVFCDRNGLQRIIENLVTNAVKYGSAKTPITIGAKVKNEFVEIFVHNDGPAISETDQKKLFSQYSRTESAIVGGQKGWGIGLSLVKEIANAHGGSVRVESFAEIGTTFYVCLALDPRPKN